MATRRTGKYEPSPSDAFKLAALQWWTHEIGRVLIEVYATDRRQYNRMATILSDATAALRSLVGDVNIKVGPEPPTACQTDQDCPSGFYCNEGTCEPRLATE